MNRVHLRFADEENRQNAKKSSLEKQKSAYICNRVLKDLLKKAATYMHTMKKKSYNL